MIARISPTILDACSHVALSAALPTENLVGVVQVESAGEPFESFDSHTPILRAEPYWFYRLLPDGKRPMAVSAGLACDAASKVSYSNQGTSADRLSVFRAMCAIDVNAAYQACSWDLGQILGKNAVPMGYSSAMAMVDEFKASVEAQINRIVKYCAMVGCLDALRSGQWEAFASAYNGLYWRRFGYAPKLATAVADWHVRLTSGQTQPPLDPAVLSIGSEGPEVTRVQTLLVALGYPVICDGHYGQKTHAAVAAYQPSTACRRMGWPARARSP